MRRSSLFFSYCFVFLDIECFLFLFIESGISMLLSSLVFSLFFGALILFRFLQISSSSSSSFSVLVFEYCLVPMYGIINGLF